MRGLRPMSPRTRIWTEIFRFVESVDFGSGDEFGTYCDGRRRISTVSAVERQKAMLIRVSIMVGSEIFGRGSCWRVVRRHLRVLRMKLAVNSGLCCCCCCCLRVATGVTWRLISIDQRADQLSHQHPPLALIDSVFGGCCMPLDLGAMLLPFSPLLPRSSR